jgi:hypothetical protein
MRAVPAKKILRALGAGFLLTLAMAACSPAKPTAPASPADTPTPFSLPPEWTETPTATITATPPPSATPTNPSLSLADGLSARPPTDEEWTQTKSIWSLTRFQELMAPGIQSYAVNVPADSVWIWGADFCTTPATFSDFLSALTIRFIVDGETLGDDRFLIVDQTSGADWVCRNWATLLSGWPAGQSVNLEVRSSLDQPASDGKNYYPAGEYRQVIVAVVGQ